MMVKTTIMILMMFSFFVFFVIAVHDQTFQNIPAMQYIIGCLFFNWLVFFWLLDKGQYEIPALFHEMKDYVFSANIFGLATCASAIFFLVEFMIGFALKDIRFQVMFEKKLLPLNIVFIFLFAAFVFFQRYQVNVRYCVMFSEYLALPGQRLKLPFWRKKHFLAMPLEFTVACTVEGEGGTITTARTIFEVDTDYLSEYHPQRVPVVTRSLIAEKLGDELTGMIKFDFPEIVSDNGQYKKKRFFVEQIPFLLNKEIQYSVSHAGVLKPIEAVV